MSMKKKFIVAASVATIGIGALGVGAANAASNTNVNGTSSLVDKMAAKFGLKKADVQAVFDANRTEHQATRQKVVANKLAAGVTAGTITQAQSDAITAKLKVLQTTRDTNRDKMETMTDAERKTAMEAERTALKQWITDNKIPDEFLRLLHGGGMGHGGMMGEDMAPPTDAAGSSTTN